MGIDSAQPRRTIEFSVHFDVVWWAMHAKLGYIGLLDTQTTATAECLHSGISKHKNKTLL